MNALTRLPQGVSTAPARWFGRLLARPNDMFDQSTDELFPAKGVDVTLPTNPEEPTQASGIGADGVVSRRVVIYNAKTTWPASSKRHKRMD
jgi:hypothetical protein